MWLESYLSIGFQQNIVLNVCNINHNNVFISFGLAFQFWIKIWKYCISCWNLVPKTVCVGSLSYTTLIFHIFKELFFCHIVAEKEHVYYWLRHIPYLLLESSFTIHPRHTVYNQNHSIIYCKSIHFNVLSFLLPTQEVDVFTTCEADGWHV